MAIDFNRAKTNTTSAASGNKEDRPKSQFWLNIGYNIEVPVVEDGKDAGTENHFVSLPVGLPLDLSQKVAIKGQSPEFVAMQTARNELLEQLMEFAETLKPGEVKDIQLTVQLRRINGEAPVIKSADNPFSKKVALTA